MKDYWFSFTRKWSCGDRISYHGGYTESWKEALIYFLKLYSVRIEKKPKVYFSKQSFDL